MVRPQQATDHTPTGDEYRPQRAPQGARCRSMPDNVTPLPKTRGGRKPGSKNKCSANTISFDMRVAIMASLNQLGKQKYLVQLGKTEPMAYAMLLKAVL